MEIIRRANAVGVFLGVLTMTITAQLSLAAAQHGVVRFRDVVISVTLSAFGPIVLIERLFVFATIEETGIRRVTKAATLADLRDTRGTCRVISVARVTGRSAKIAATEKRFAVNAVAIFGQLRGGQR